jgi:hypothetical protein
VRLGGRPFHEMGGVITRAVKLYINNKLDSISNIETKHNTRKKQKQKQNKKHH